MLEATPVIVALLAFASVAGIVLVVGRFMESESVMRRRLSTAELASGSVGFPESISPGFFAALADKVDERKFGIEGTLRGKLRRDLMRAGFFSESAIRFYVIARLALVLFLPAMAYILCKIFFPDMSYYLNLLIVGIAALLGIAGVDAYVARRQRTLRQQYRLVFPDLIDMLVVCSDAGLSLDLAFARIRPEVSKKSSAMGINLGLLGAEMRAGRAMTDAINGFADRLNLDEARAMAIMLRQSLDLGTEISDALRVYSDEMRGKRLLRAEETANKLPVKMVLPLGMLIFPVILVVVLLPIIINLMTIFAKTG